jgi:glycosyltransferase involved in cell wall biosynthesis
VLPPPVDIEAFTFRREKGDYDHAAARMVPYKKMPIIVEAFARMPDKRLVVVGEGPDFDRCRKLATPNIELVGYMPFGKLREYMQGARAFVFAAEEDFGITLVEVQACGTPVIAFGRGGAREIVQPLGSSPAPTGVFFDEQLPEAIVDAVARFEGARGQICPHACRNNVERFSLDLFRSSLKRLVDEALQAHNPHTPADRHDRPAVRA